MKRSNKKSDGDELRRSLLRNRALNNGFFDPPTMPTTAQEFEVSDEEAGDEASDNEDLQDNAPVLTSLVECYNRLSGEAERQLSDNLKTAELSGSTDIYVVISEGALSEAIEGIITKLRNYAKSRELDGEDTSSWVWTGKVENVKFPMDEDKPDIFDTVEAEVSLTAKGTRGDEKVQCEYLARSTWVPDSGWRPVLVARGDVCSAWRMRKINEFDFE